MSQALEKIRDLATFGNLRISEHRYDELASDHLSAREVVQGLTSAIVVEDYPSFHNGPCVVVLQRDETGQPVHVDWGIAKNCEGPAVLITAYRPDPGRWDASFTSRP